jgi:ferredoxin-type protein NapF
MPMMQQSRRQFLLGDFAGRVVRGPGTLADIGAACLALKRVVCRSCGEACEAGAIRVAPRAGGVAVPAVDAAGCTGCGACRDACPAGAVALRPVATPATP